MLQRPSSAARTAARAAKMTRHCHDLALEDAGLSPAIRLHDLRHTAATLRLAAGESILARFPLLGTRATIFRLGPGKTRLTSGTFDGAAGTES
jgi:hypothetical protein